MQRKKRIAAIITEYWDICHADVIVTKMLEGFSYGGRDYGSTVEIVSMFIDKFPDNDIGKAMAEKHQIPLYSSIRDALLNNEEKLNIDGILLIGEHGDYPDNELGQTLYPRRLFFEQCLEVMREQGRIIPVYSDKGFAVVYEDIHWMYEQIKRHDIPFMSSSVVPFSKRQPIEHPFPHGAPLHKMFAFAYGSLERYTYHSLEMLQSLAENRAYGEAGIVSVEAFREEEALQKARSKEWKEMHDSLARFAMVGEIEQFLARLVEPVFFEIEYADGLKAGILYVDAKTPQPTIQSFYANFKVYADEPPTHIEFWLQPQKPYSHFGLLVLEIERFFHTSKPPFPVERSLLTTGALDACMRSLHTGEKILTPELTVKYS